MALRVLEYTALLYGELLRRGLAKPGALPPVLPLVLYTGDAARPGGRVGVRCANSALGGAAVAGAVPAVAAPLRA